MGGYVVWRAGEKDDGSDSFAQEVAPVSHWPEMKALILIVSAEKKTIGSTAGMQVTVKTSQLFKTRAQEVVPEHMRLMEEAIRQRDFQKFAEVTMRDSNNFHAVCRDSWPPIEYLNEVSLAAVKIVESINTDRYYCAYTFDAGPNPVIYYLQEDAPLVEGTFKGLLEHVDGWTGAGSGVKSIESMRDLNKAERMLKTGISRVICSGVGSGPERVEQHLI